MGMRPELRLRKDQRGLPQLVTRGWGRLGTYSQARSRYGCSVAVLRRQSTTPKYRRLAHMPEEYVPSRPTLGCSMAVILEYDMRKR